MFRMIKKYRTGLKNQSHSAPTSPRARSPTELNYNIDANKAQHELIRQLESKNREILREIQRLRQEQEQQAKFGSEHRHTSNPTLLAELRLLRQRRDELEARMQALQDSRRELMVQLEGLMKLLRVGACPSPRSTPTSSPRSRSAQSPPINSTNPLGTHTTSTTATSQSSATSCPTTPGDALVGDVRQAFTMTSSGGGGGSTHSSSVKSLRNDLLVAADSVTNAMSSLVKELNSEAEGSDEEDEGTGGMDEEGNKHCNKNDFEDFLVLQEEMQQRLRQESDFLRELQSRKQNKVFSGHNTQDNFISSSYSREVSHDDLLTTDDGESYVRTDDESCMRTDEEEIFDNDPKLRRNILHPNRYTTDDESCLETDQESYIRTDDEEGGNTEWEESMRRWVNR